MNKKIIVTIIFMLLVPGVGLTAAVKTKIITGVITRINPSGLAFSTGSGAGYSADIANAVLARKNGANMQFSEFLVGDKIEVKGTTWGDNSISASSIRDLTLYAHTGTFTGKILTINPQDSSFTVQSSQPTLRTIHTNSLTSFKKNGSGAAFSDLIIGMSVSVKGFWERKDSNITATQVLGTLRLVSIDITGTLNITSPESLTVVSNNTIYGVDITKAKLQNKKGKTINLMDIRYGDTLRVQGKHVSGSVKIEASTVKDMSVVK